MTDFEERLAKAAAEIDARAAKRRIKEQHDRKEYSRRYYQKHKEKIKAYTRAHSKQKIHLKNIDKSIALLKAEGYRIEKDGQTL